MKTNKISLFAKRIICVIFLLNSIYSFSQNSKEIDNEILSIENGLISAVLTGSAVIKTYSIDERLKLFKVTGASIAVCTFSSEPFSVNFME